MFLSFLQDLFCPWLVFAWKGKGAVNSLEIPCSLLWAGNRHSSPLALLFSHSSQAIPGFGQLGRPGSALQTGKQSPLRFQQRGERSYELMVCAQHSWQGSLHEFLKQFSAETAPSITWNSIFQGKSSLVWAADQLPCHLLTQLLWPGELWAAPATPGLHQGSVWPMSSTFLPLPA